MSQTGLKQRYSPTNHVVEATRTIFPQNFGDHVEAVMRENLRTIDWLYASPRTLLL